MIGSCNDALDEDDMIPDFDGCIGCSRYKNGHCEYEDESENNG